mgnify:CR=1 FL=1
MQPAALPRLHARIRPEILHKKSERKVHTLIVASVNKGFPKTKEKKKKSEVMIEEVILWKPNRLRSYGP